MVRKKRTMKKPTAKHKKAGKSATLDSVTADDALKILKTLVQRDGKLAKRIDAVTAELLGRIDPTGLAGDVQAALESLQPEDVWDRAGKHRDGYVEPSVAAWQIFEETLEPSRREVEKYRRLGMLKEAARDLPGNIAGRLRFRAGIVDGIQGLGSGCAG